MDDPLLESSLYLRHSYMGSPVPIGRELVDLLGVPVLKNN